MNVGSRLRFFWVVDRLIHRGTRRAASADRLLQLRLLAGMAASMVVQCSVFGIAMWSQMEPAIVLPFFAMLFAETWVLLRLRLTGATRFSGTVLWVSLYGISFYAALHEGSMLSFISPGAVMIVMLALYLDGLWAGAVAAALTLAGIVVVAFAHGTGRTLAPIIAGDPFVPLAVGATMSFAGAVFLAWLNHSSRHRATDELKAALTRAERAETELRLAQKLEAVGRLAGGVAHEINTPLQVISSNVEFIKVAFHDIAAMVERYETLAKLAMAGPVPLERFLELDAERERVDLAYVLHEGPSACERSVSAVEHVTRIVQSMQTFASAGAKNGDLLDLNAAVKNTLKLANAQLKNVAQVELQLGDLPHIVGHAGELNLVVLNLLLNAAKAIADKHQGSALGKLAVKTWREAGHAVLAITDDGVGIEAAIQSRIFDPFFTTRVVGSGTGQGLAMAHAVVVQQHKGSLTFITEPGAGSTFFMRLPLGEQPAVLALAG